jgi:hypothetical protein
VGFLTDYVSKGQRKWKGTYVPEWMPAARWVVAIAACSVLALSFITGNLRSSDNTEAFSASTPGTSVPTDIPIAPEPTGLPSSEPSAGKAPADTGRSVAVAIYGGGGTLDVPAEAVQVARAALRGIFTANFAGVPVQSGRQLPAVPNPQPGARIGRPETVQQIGDTLVIALQVDLDGPGPGAPYPAAVTVVQEAGRYVFVP